MNRLLRLAQVMAALLLLPACGSWAAEYVLGPEDVLQVKVARHPELDTEATVLPDGTIMVPRGGVVRVAGLTLAQARDAIADALSEILWSPEVSVNTKITRPNRIHVLGQVNKPGTYDLKPGWRVMEALAEAGGLKSKPELCSATLFRRDGTTIPIDMAALHIKRDPAANIELRPLDVLDVQEAPTVRVYVNGQGVKSPGQFDITEGLGVIEALAMAGGLTVKPEQARATIFRRGGTTETVDLVALQSRGDGKANIILKPYDVLDVQPLPTTRVYVSGQGVKSPGEYDITEGLGVVQALAAAGGPTPNAALRRAVVIRAEKPGQPRQEIPVDLYGPMVEGTSPPDLVLEPGDTLVVPEVTDRIAVFGLVKTPGYFPLPETQSFTVADAVALAGGAEKRAQLSKVRVVRRTTLAGEPAMVQVDVNSFLKKGDPRHSVVLRPGDTVFVPETGRPDFFGRIIPALTSLSLFSYYLGR